MNSPFFFFYTKSIPKNAPSGEAFLMIMLNDYYYLLAFSSKIFLKSLYESSNAFISVLFDMDEISDDVLGYFGYVG